MKKDISQPFQRGAVSAQILDQATRFNLVELQTIAATLSNLLLRRTKKPP